MLEKSYAVTDMTCAACAARVEKVLARLDGVESANVNLATEKVSIRFDESKLDFDAIRSTVEKAGYGLIDERAFKTIELAIDGMSCSACSAAVERTVKKLEGVKSASVNLAMNRGIFEYDPSIIKLSELMAAIVKSGYRSLGG